MADTTPSKYPATLKYAADTIVELVAMPGVGYRFVGWEGSTTEITPKISVKMECPKSITAKFAPILHKLTVIVQPTGKGTVDLEPPQPADGYMAGTRVTLRPHAGQGEVFDSWSGDATGTLPAAAVVMDADRTVTVTFIERKTSFTAWIVGVLAVAVLAGIIYVYVIRRPGKPGKR